MRWATVTTACVHRQHPGVDRRRACGNGRPTAMPPAPTSSCRANTCAARATASSPTPRAAAAPLTTTQSGWYLQGVYQFMPRWRVGLRTERLDSGRGQRCLSDAVYRPRKNSLMLDFNPSEFSRVRLQLARDRLALRPARQPAVPAIPDEPGRPRRPQLLNASRRNHPCHCISRTSRPSSAVAAGGARAAGPCRLARVRLRTRMGRAGAGTRRRPGGGDVGHQRVAGPAPDPGQAQPDRPRAQRRPGGVHRRRTRDRLAAAAAAAVGQCQGAARPAGQLRGGRFRAQAGGADPARSLAGRRARGGQSAHPDRSAQHRRWWPRRSRRGCSRSIRRMRRSTPSARPISRSAGSRPWPAGARRPRR